MTNQVEITLTADELALIRVALNAQEDALSEDVMMGRGNAGQKLEAVQSLLDKLKAQAK